MKNRSANLNTITKIKRVWLLPGLVLILILLILGQTVPAQKEPDVVVKPFKVNGKEVKEYLIEKYKLSKHDVSSRLKQTPYGPKGYLSIRGGEFKPKFMPMTENIQDRARAIARAFLEEEAAVFDIANMEEIREISIETDKGYGGDYTYIRYKRFINNLELDGVDIRITVGPDETIRRGMAYLVPVPSELYEVVKKKTFIEDKVLIIVAQDLESVGVDSKDLRVLRIEKVAIPSPPYIVWKVDINLKKGGGRWKYRIDAFTGEVLEKRNALIIN